MGNILARLTLLYQLSFSNIALLNDFCIAQIVIQYWFLRWERKLSERYLKEVKYFTKNLRLNWINNLYQITDNNLKEIFSLPVLGEWYKHCDLLFYKEFFTFLIRGHFFVNGVYGTFHLIFWFLLLFSWYNLFWILEAQ